MITIHFSRPLDTARHVMPPNVGDYFHEGADAIFTVCRHMTDAGEPDGPAVFVDERGMACMTVRSFHSCARRYLPNEADRVAKAAAVAAAKLAKVNI